MQRLPKQNETNLTFQCGAVAIASRLEGITGRLEAIAVGLEAIAFSFLQTFLPLVASLLLVERPGAPSSLLAPSAVPSLLHIPIIVFAKHELCGNVLLSLCWNRNTKTQPEEKVVHFTQRSQ